MKTCIKCNEVKPLDEFHKSKVNKDGRYGSCKVCSNAASRQWRTENPERKAALDKRWRQSHPERKAASQAKYGGKNPLKIKAQSAVNHAIRDGKLTRPDNCSECGIEARIHGHHDDYTKPLDVRWLCHNCHIAWHQEHGYDLNGEAA